MRRIAVYYRVSTDRQDLKSQRTAVEKWLSERSVPLDVMVFQDEARSGSDEKRPGYKAMLEAAYLGEIDTIVVYKLDRFSRSASRAIRTLLELDELGVSFVSVTQAVLNLGADNPFKRTMLSAFAEIAQIERETISGRVKSGLAAAVKDGKKLGRKHQISAEKKDQARVMKADGHTYREIATALKVSKSSVHYLLKESTSIKRPTVTDSRSVQ